MNKRVTLVTWNILDTTPILPYTLNKKHNAAQKKPKTIINEMKYDFISLYL